MRIIRNTTPYDTRALRRVICSVHNHMAKAEGRLPQWKRLKIAIQGREGDRTSGWAYYGKVYGPGWDVFFRLPRKNCTRQEFAWLVYHELMHSYGYKHSQYTNIRYSELHAALGQEWCRAPIPLAVHAIKPPRDIKAVRYARLLARQKAWGSKLSRAQNALKAVRREVRTYERRHPHLVATGDG